MQCFLSPPPYIGGDGVYFFRTYPTCRQVGGDFPPHLTQNFNESGEQEVDYFHKSCKLYAYIFPNFLARALSGASEVTESQMMRKHMKPSLHELHFLVFWEISSGVFCRIVGGISHPKRPTPIPNTGFGNFFFRFSSKNFPFKTNGGTGKKKAPQNQKVFQRPKNYRKMGPKHCKTPV